MVYVCAYNTQESTHRHGTFHKSLYCLFSHSEVQDLQQKLVGIVLNTTDKPKIHFMGWSINKVSTGDLQK
jgi:hypothetical protein